MKRGLILGLLLLAAGGCGEAEYDADQEIRGAMRQLDRETAARNASYGEPSGCLRTSVGAALALDRYYFREDRPRARRRTLRIVAESAAVEGKELAGGPADLRRGTYFVSVIPIDGRIPVVAMSERAFETGSGTVMNSRNFAKLPGGASEDANRARACLVKKLHRR